MKVVDWQNKLGKFIIPSISVGVLLLVFISLNFAKADNVNQVETETQTGKCDLVVMSDSGAINRYRCSDRLSEAEAASYLQQEFKTSQVQTVKKYKLALEPNDLYYQKYQRSYLTRINAPDAWQKMGIPVLRPIIAVLDSGVDIDNPDLKPNIWFNPWEVPGDKIDNDKNGYVDDQYGWDFVSNSGDPKPKYYTGWTEVAMNHGTIVAGVAAAAGNNQIGVAGVSWNARIMPLRVLDSKGEGDTVTVAKAIQYAIDSHADIINLSFVGEVSDPILEQVISRAYKAGLLVVAAAGNEQEIGVDMNKTPQYPVCDDGWNGENQIIGVAALDERDVRAGFSNYGSKCIDISAPGTGIFSTQFYDAKNEKFSEYYGGYWAGTSVATPMVSGALAVLKSLYPRLSPSQLRDILIASGDSVDAVNPSNVGQLGRRLNLKAALALANSNTFAYKSPLVIGPFSKSAANIGIFDISGELMTKFLSYEPNFTSGVNIAAADFNNDGQTDIVTVPRAGGGPHVKIFNQKGQVEFQFMALNDKYRGGLSVAAADFTGDKIPEIVIGTGKGVVNMIQIYDIYGNVRYQFIPYDPSYLGGVNIAVGDIDDDGQPEIVVAPQDGKRLPIRTFDKFGTKKSEFYAYPTAIKGGINVAVGDIDGNKKKDILTAPGAGGGPQVRIFNWQGWVLNQFFVFDKNFRGGVTLAVGDVDGDGSNEVAAVPGAGGGPNVRVFNGRGELKSNFVLEPKNFRGGLVISVLP